MHDKSVLLWLSGKILKKENQTNKTPEARKQPNFNRIHLQKKMSMLALAEF